MVLTTLLFAMRDVGTSTDITTMDEFVDTFTETLVSWSSQSTTDVGRGRRSTDSSSSTQPSEYVNVNCNLMCIIETQGEESHRQILVCTSGNKDNHRKGIPVRTTCVEHASGRLLHMIIAVPDASADYLDNDFAKAVSDAMHTMTPEPETLYLTIEIPLLTLHRNDFTALSSKVRRLSVYLGQAVHVDPNVLTALSLESFSLEGCRLKKTRVFQNESRRCDVNFLYTCPKIGEFVLSVDRTGWARLCSESSYNHSSTQYFEKQSVCGCNDYKSLLEALHNSKKAYLEAEHALDSEYKQLFLISLATNLILSFTLLIICLFTVIQCVQNYQGSNRNKA
ncbi:hypothetical protein TSMEX_004684 [Taenia solium]|eukprot:TsM_000322700 transcript=TsM_000322700 gene=TsM_000322700